MAGLYQCQRLQGKDHGAPPVWIIKTRLCTVVLVSILVLYRLFKEDSRGQGVIIPSPIEFSV